MMVTAGPEKVSSILLSAPGFDDEFDLWAGPVFAMLETCVGAIEAEEMIGIVCFHPKCKTGVFHLVLSLLPPSESYLALPRIIQTYVDQRCHS